MKYSGQTAEFCGIALGLFQCRRQVNIFPALDLNVNIFQSHKVRFNAIAHSLTGPHIVAAGLEYLRKLDFGASAF